MPSLEKTFIKEFKKNIRGRALSGSIYSMPLPRDCENWEVSNCEIYGVSGISIEGGGLFAKLNKTLVKRLPRGQVARRKKADLVNKCFVKDSNGSYVYEEVSIPHNSVVIISKDNLKLPFRYRSMEDGFGYIDVVLNKGVKEYLYYIPKKYLYLTNQTALALSVKNMKNYSGMGYVSWDYGVVYLHVIPYNINRKYVGTKILKTSHGLNYTREVKNIVSFWQSNGIIPDINLCNTVEEGNLVLRNTSRGFEDYEFIEELSLGDKEIYGTIKEEE